MEPLSGALAEELERIASRLQNAGTEPELSLAIDDLLDLTRDTQAYTYVQDLVRRSSPPVPGNTRELNISADIGIPAPAPAQALPGASSSAPGEATRMFQGPVAPPSPVPGMPPVGAAPAMAASGLAEIRESSGALASMITTDSGIAWVPVFFATNRSTTLRTDAPFNDAPATKLTYGTASVSIPVDKHKLGKMETPHWWTLFPSLGAEQRFITLGNVELLEQPAFATRLASTIQGAKANDLLVFVHGYNVGFEEGARRAAQIAYDMNFPGAVVLFSWPSSGSFNCYSSDEERAFASADRFAAFLKSLEDGPWRRVHVMAHSMGNRVMLLGLADNARPRLPLGQVVFTAADVYVPLFEDKFPKLQDAGQLPATSYASSRDWPLRLSSMLHRGPRVGLIAGTPFVAPMLETVDASSVDTVFLGHGYFAGARSLITDLRLLLLNNLSPTDRGLAPAKGYWFFRE
jgi:esterase/lipase superfamily enzyme